jgi:type IV secretory pathway protease TraF
VRVIHNEVAFMSFFLNTKNLSISCCAAVHTLASRICANITTSKRIGFYDVYYKYLVIFDVMNI